MTYWLLSFSMIGLLMFAMGIGVMVSGRELQGSCGGTGINCHCREEGIEPENCPLDMSHAPSA